MVSSSASSGASRSLQNLTEMQSRIAGTPDRSSSDSPAIGEFSAMIANASQGPPQIDDTTAIFVGGDLNSDGSVSPSTVELFGGAAPPGPSQAADAVAQTATASASDAELASKLAQMLGQMSQAFAGAGGQQPSGFSTVA